MNPIPTWLGLQLGGSGSNPGSVQGLLRSQGLMRFTGLKFYKGPI